MFFLITRNHNNWPYDEQETTYSSPVLREDVSKNKRNVLVRRKVLHCKDYVYGEKSSPCLLNYPPETQAQKNNRNLFGMGNKQKVCLQSPNC